MSSFNFRFDGLPKGWADQTVYRFKGPTVEGFEHSMSLTLDRNLQPDGVTLREFVAGKLDGILKCLPKGDLVYNEPVNLGAVDGHHLAVRWGADETLVRVYQYYFALVYGVGYTFWSMYTPLSFSELKDARQAEVAALLCRALVN